MEEVSLGFFFRKKESLQRKRIVAPLRCRGLIDVFEKSFAKPLWKKFHWGFSFARKKAGKENFCGILTVFFFRQLSSENPPKTAGAKENPLHPFGFCLTADNRNPLPENSGKTVIFSAFLRSLQKPFYRQEKRCPPLCRHREYSLRFWL